MRHISITYIGTPPHDSNRIAVSTPLKRMIRQAVDRHLHRTPREIEHDQADYAHPKELTEREYADDVQDYTS